MHDTNYAYLYDSVCVGGGACVCVCVVCVCMCVCMSPSHNRPCLSQMPRCSLHVSPAAVSSWPGCPAASRP